MLVTTQELFFKYTRGNHFNFPDLKIQYGDQWLVKGISGSGKTTFLHLLAGLLHPTSGRITINNQEIEQMSPAEMDKFRGRNIGLIFQRHHFIGAISMRQNLLSAQTLPGFLPDLKHIDELTVSLGIKSLLHKKPEVLSQGELQRFSVARALVNKPLLLLADEPTSSLDDRNASAFVNIIIENAAKYQTSLIIATHDARLKDRFTNIYEL